MDLGNNRREESHHHNHNYQEKPVTEHPYSDDYYSLNELALGSETHENTWHQDQQIDRLGVEYDYYDYEVKPSDKEPEKTSEASEEDEPEYEVYYYYYYDYVDPEDLKSNQVEKLPKPSYQANSDDDKVQ